MWGMLFFGLLVLVLISLLVSAVSGLLRGVFGLPEEPEPEHHYWRGSATFATQRTLCGARPSRFVPWTSDPEAVTCPKCRDSFWWKLDMKRMESDADRRRYPPEAVSVLTAPVFAADGASLDLLERLEPGEQGRGLVHRL